MSEATHFEIRDMQGNEIKLAMQSLWLAGRLLPVGGRLWVRHEFASADSRPLEVVYSFMLPRDAALRRFRVETSSGSIESELKPTEEAVKTYEEGVQAGALSTMARAYEDGIVNLNCGNIRPGERVTVLLEILAGVELRDGGFRFRFPFTLAPSYHSQARAAVAPDGSGEMELPRQFDDVMLPRWANCADGLHQVGFEMTLDAGPVQGVASPSHSIRMRNGKVSLAVAGDVPDRDLVLDVETAPKAFLASGSADDGKKHFAAIIPAVEFGENQKAPRSVVIVLDRSGSMQGAPLQQAKAAINACLAVLEADDRLGLVAFSSQAEAWKPGLVPASKENRASLASYLARVSADGGTELQQALSVAAGVLGREGGEIFLVTDGQVFGTGQIVSKAGALGGRIHVLGIGSASQDRFLSQLARETGGVSRFLTPRERVDLGAAELFASIGHPVARIRSVEVSDGQVLCGLQTEVFTGTPVHYLGVGSGELRVAFDGGERVWPLAESQDGETLRLLEGARRIADIEARGAEGAREVQRVKAALRQLSQDYGLASREMTLVSVMRREGDVAGDVPKTILTKVRMPQDVEYLALFGQAGPSFMLAQKKYAAGITLGAADFLAVREETTACPSPAQELDVHFKLAAMLDSDGGMPGRDESERIAHSLVAVLVLAQAGSTMTSGPFRIHIQRLIDFLDKCRLNPAERQAVEEVRAGRVAHTGLDELAARIAGGESVSREEIFAGTPKKSGVVRRLASRLSEPLRRSRK